MVGGFPSCVKAAQITAISSTGLVSAGNLHVPAVSCTSHSTLSVSHVSRNLSNLPALTLKCLFSPQRAPVKPSARYSKCSHSVQIGLVRLSSSANYSHFFPDRRSLSMVKRNRRTVTRAEDKDTGQSSQQDPAEFSTPAAAMEEKSQQLDSKNQRMASPLPASSLPTDVVAWGGTLPPTRRLVIGGLLGASVILGGNLAGVTSLLLGLSPDLSRGARFDLIFPVQGYKRCLETSRGFEFIYPARWVGDQRLLYRAVERAERERSLDLPSLRVEQAKARRRAAVEPIVAYGPPGSEGELNVSVVVAPVAPGFRLEKLGDPREAGERILSTIVAPEGSDKEAVLLNASERKEGHLLYYTLEFTVKGPTFFRHNMSVYATYNDLLYTLNAQTPETSWESVRGAFTTMASSFRVTAEGAQGGSEPIPRNL